MPNHCFHSHSHMLFNSLAHKKAGCEQLKNQSSPNHSPKHITDLKFPPHSATATRRNWTAKNMKSKLGTVNVCLICKH